MGHNKTAAWIEAGIIRDLDAIAYIESAKLDITCDDTYIGSYLNFVARHNKFIDNNVTYLFSQPVCDYSRCYRLLCTWNVTVDKNLIPGFGT